MGIDFREDIQPLLKTLLIASAAIVLGYLIFSSNLEAEDSSLKIVTMIIGGAIIAVGAGFILWPVGRMMVSAFEAIFWPESSYKSPANYKLAEWYCQQGRYAEALEAYEKIVENYPRELDGWIGLLNVSIYYMGDVGAGEKIFHRAARALNSDADRQAVQEHYAAISAGIQSRTDIATGIIPGASGDPDIPAR